MKSNHRRRTEDARQRVLLPDGALAALELDVPVSALVLDDVELEVPGVELVPEVLGDVPEVLGDVPEVLGDVLELLLVLPGLVLVEPDIVVDELLLLFGVVDELVDGLVLVDGLPVPLLEVLLVLPPGVVLGVAVVDDVLLESRVVVVTSSRFVQAVMEARAISVMAPACAILNAVMAVPLGKVAEALWFARASTLSRQARAHL